MLGSLIRTSLRNSLVAIFIGAIAIAASANQIITLEGSNRKAAPQTIRDCEKICPELIILPKGEFVMGATDNQPHRTEDLPAHRVTINYQIAIGKYDVTFSEWDACVQDGGCGGYKPKDNGWGRGNRPVINISWEDAQQYTKWLSKHTGHLYRLPSSAEWEYAARAGSTKIFYTGDVIERDRTLEGGDKGDANFGYSLGRTTEVGKYRPNAFGLFDMIGNVMQWTQDCDEEEKTGQPEFKDYTNAPTDGAARDRVGCRIRIYRGGSWSTSPFPSYMHHDGPVDARSNDGGFRVMRVFQEKQ